MKANTAQERLNTRLNQLSAAVPPVPLDARLSGSKLTWVEPADTAYITHYLIRVGSDAAAPTYVVPVGSTACNLANGDSQFWLSSGNAAMGTESPMVHIAGQVDLIAALSDVQSIDGAPWIEDSLTGDSSVLIYVGRYNPPAEASGFAGVVAYWEVPSSPVGKFVFAGEADYNGVITATDSTRYGTFRLRTSLPAVAATWGLRLVPKGASWRGSVSTDSPVRTIAVPAAASSDSGNNAIDNGSFEFGMSRWFGFTAGVTTDNTVSKSPNNSCAITATTAQTVQQPEFASVGNADVLPCNPGDRLQFSGFYQFAASSTNTVGIARLVCYDSAGTETGSSDSAPFNAAVVAWEGFTLSLTAPASTAYARWIPFTGYIDSGTLYIDTLLGRVSSQATEPNRTPLDYGAVGDGTADDTTPVLACMTANAAWEVPGGYVFLTDPLVFTSRTDIRITGTGKLKKRTGSAGDVLLAFDNSTARISQVALDANGADYCVRLGGTLGSEAWFESCDFSDFAIDPLDVDTAGGSDYYAYNNSGLADRLVWVAAVRPSALAVTVSPLSDGLDQYSVSLVTTIPGGTDPEEMVAMEYQGVYFDDVALTTPTGGYVSSLGMVADGSVTFGPFPRTDTDAWILPRVRAYNALGRYSAWRDAGAAAKIDSIPAPPAPTYVASTFYGDATTYGFASVWTPAADDPAKTKAVSFERRAFFFYNALGTGTPDEVSIGFEPSTDIRYAIDGPWPLPEDTEAWAKVGVRALNYRGVASDWTYSQGLMKINIASASGVEGGLGDITIQSGAAVDWTDFAATGEVSVEITYAPYYTGSGVSRTTAHRAVQIFVERRVEDKAVAESQGYAPYDGATAALTPPDNWGKFHAHWKPFEGDVWVQGCAVGDSTQFPWKAASSTPPLAPTSRWQQFTITQAEIDSYGAATVVAAPNAVSITAGVIYGKGKDAAGVEFDGFGVGFVLTWPASNWSRIRNPRLILNEVGGAGAGIVMLPHLDVPTSASQVVTSSTEYCVPRPAKATDYTVSVQVENSLGDVTASPATSPTFTVDPVGTVPTMTISAIRRTPILYGPTGAETYGVDYVGTWPDTADFNYGEIWVTIVEDAGSYDRGLVGRSKAGGTDRGFAFVGSSDQWAMPDYSFTARVTAYAFSMAGVKTEVGHDDVAMTPGSALGGGLDFQYSDALGKYEMAVKVGRGAVINSVTGAVDSTVGGLLNGTFEAGLSGWGTRNNAFTVVSGSEAYFGQSAKATGNGTNQSLVYENFPVVPGRSYRISAWCSNTATAGQAYFDAEFSNASGDLAGGDIRYPGAGYHEETIIVTAPAGATSMYIRFQLNAAAVSGAYYVDNVDVQLVTSVAASATPPANLRMHPTSSTQPFGVFPTGPDANGIKQWYNYVQWTAETPTAERTQMYFGYVLANSSWVAITAFRPLAGITIGAGGVDLPPQAYTAAASNAIMYAYVESKDGSRALCAAMQFIIPAGPTGQLNPLQLDLAKADGFRVNPSTGKFEVTQAGVMARLALAAHLGIDITGALEVQGINASWVLASLVAVSGAVVVSNTQASITISSDGTITILKGGNKVEIDASGVRISGGGASLYLNSSQITCSFVNTSGLNAGTGGVVTSGNISCGEVYAGSVGLHAAIDALAARLTAHGI